MMNSNNWKNNKIIKIAAITTGVLIVIAIFSYTSLVYTSKPTFCSNCHYMEPYVEGWKASSHKDVECTKCHFPPGFKSKIKGKLTAASMVVNYMTGIYKKSKPWAEISDTSCLRSGCHQERLLEGKVTFKEGIIFDHKPHLTKLRREKKLRCTSCHSQIVQGEHISVTESTCFLCHFKNQPEEASINNCIWCHSAPVPDEKYPNIYNHTFILEQNIDCIKCHGEMQVGDGAVPIERCSSCHAEIGKINKIDDHILIHNLHVTEHKVECQNCHLAIQHKSVSKSAAIVPDCQSCHEGLHSAQLGLFAGTGGTGVPSHPDPMYDAGLNCQACHIFHKTYGNGHYEETTSVAKGESCERCHGKGYGKLFDQWEEVMKQKLTMVQKSIDDVTEELAKQESIPHTSQRISRLMNTSVENFQLVKQGNIVHNVAYSDELLTSSSKNLNTILDLIESPISIPDISLFSRLVPSECRNCHYGQEEISIEVFGLTFSHNIHIVKNELDCSRCHSNLNGHGRTTVTRNDCLACHHTQEVVECEVCHSLQAQFYSGNVEFAYEQTPDIMFDEDILCKDCHGGEDEPVKKSEPESCSNCHDEEYEDILSEWQTDTANLIQQIENRLQSINRTKVAPEIQSELEQISTQLNLIKKDKSQGVHNIDLITSQLNAYMGFLMRYNL